MYKPVEYFEDLILRCFGLRIALIKAIDEKKNLVREWWLDGSEGITDELVNLLIESRLQYARLHVQYLFDGTSHSGEEGEYLIE